MIQPRTLAGEMTPNELDCDREASRDLNRLLDGPGGSERGAMQIYL